MFLNYSRYDSKVVSEDSVSNHAAPRGHKRDSFRPTLEVLEDRLTPATVGKPVPTITFPITINKGANGSDGFPTPEATGAYTPAQIRQAYGIDQVTLGNVVGDGTGQTIAIIDAYDNPGLVSSTSPDFDTSDLHLFDVEFGLPDPPSFLKLDQNGGTNYPSTEGPSNAQAEEDLDVEWAHAIAPKANIILYEANTLTDPDLFFGALQTAKNNPQVSVISMSFGGPEDAAEEEQIDPLFTTPPGHQGITFLASAGDTGSPGGYPAYSPNVVAVGGTNLVIDAAGNYISETTWNDAVGATGGGISQFEPQPTYQRGVVTQTTTNRAMPDVALEAGLPGVVIYDSFNNTDGSGPWFGVEGTSFSSPAWAGIIAIANQDRARFGLGTLDGPTQTLPLIYSLPESDFHDITTGNNSFQGGPGFSAGPGYDLTTGRGTPIAQLLIPDLAQVSSLTSSIKNYHPFRYIVDATLPQDGTVDEGTITIINTSSLNPKIQFYLVLGPLPDSVTLDPSVPTTTFSDGTVAINLPVSGLPSNQPVRVQLKFRNPHHVAISTFFEGFSISLVTAPT
jgi:hypothetical protein